MLNEAQACFRAGVILAQQGMLAEAVASLERSLLLRPQNADAHNELANVLFAQGQYAAANAHYERVIRLRPDSAEACYNLANGHTRLGNLEEAVRNFGEAIRLNPKLVMAHNNLAIALKRQNKLEEAKRSYQEALRLAPEFVDAITNLGVVYEQEGNFDQAIACYERALRIDPEHVNLHFHRAGLWLLQGEWAKGWPEYEWRWKTKEMPGYGFRQPRWAGASLEGRTILLVAEQGLGDTIQFVRYASLVKQRGGKVILQCDAALMPLLASATGIDEMVPREAPLPSFDCYAPLLSLPAIFQTTPDNAPAPIPYLAVNGELVEHWRRRLQSFGGLKIGIAWQGNPNFLDDHLRSMPLKCFRPLAMPDVTLISLQKGPGADQLKENQGVFAVVSLSDELDGAHGPFMDTAAIMRHLDLVICSDTSIAHLAGALGVRTWLALPYVPDWRWLLNRTDTPWYPTMRLFRQSRRCHWDDVFQRMAAELMRLVGSQAASGNGKSG